MNIELILRMREHGYTAEDIHLRLRHSVEIICMVFETSDKLKKVVKQQVDHRV